MSSVSLRFSRLLTRIEPASAGAKEAVGEGDRPQARRHYNTAGVDYFVNGASVDYRACGFNWTKVQCAGGASRSNERSIETHREAAVSNRNYRRTMLSVMRHAPAVYCTSH